jgi:hypothetical protein
MDDANAADDGAIDEAVDVAPANDEAADGVLAEVAVPAPFAFAVSACVAGAVDPIVGPAMDASSFAGASGDRVTMKPSATPPRTTAAAAPIHHCVRRIGGWEEAPHGSRLGARRDGRSVLGGLLRVAGGLLVVAIASLLLGGAIVGMSGS